MPPDISVKELQNAQFDLYTYTIDWTEQGSVQPIIIYFLCYKSKLLSINKRQNNVIQIFQYILGKWYNVCVQLWQRRRRRQYCGNEIKIKKLVYNWPCQRWMSTIFTHRDKINNRVPPSDGFSISLQIGTTTTATTKKCSHHFWHRSSVHYMNCKYI